MEESTTLPMGQGRYSDKAMQYSSPPSILASGITMNNAESSTNSQLGTCAKVFSTWDSIEHTGLAAPEIIRLCDLGPKLVCTKFCLQDSASIQIRK